MTTGYVDERVFNTLLGCLTSDNSLCLRVMMSTGMRISDALALTWEQLGSTLDGLTFGYLTYTERKTGKERTVCIRDELFVALKARQRAFSDRQLIIPWVFPGRNPARSRTRQAVWKDLHRAARLFRVNGKRLAAHLGTHSARKVYAVKLYHEAQEMGLYDPLETVRIDLNHKDKAVTMLYALADVITARGSYDGLIV